MFLNINSKNYIPYFHGIHNILAFEYKEDFFFFYNLKNNNIFFSFFIVKFIVPKFIKNCMFFFLVEIIWKSLLIRVGHIQHSLNP
jgi:hypothetical protein